MKSLDSVDVVPAIDGSVVLDAGGIRTRATRIDETPTLSDENSKT